MPRRHTPPRLPSSRLALAAAIAGLAFCAGALGASVTGAEAKGPGKREPLIIGGNVAPPGAYPWMAALVEARLPAERGQFCGGTLVRPRVVLTAGHCVSGLAPREVDVVVGRDRLSSREGLRIDVERVGSHPKTDLFAGAHDVVRNDVAQVKLKEPATEIPRVSLASPEEEELRAAGQAARVLGWGLVKERGVESADELRQADISIASDRACKKAYPGYSKESQICAGAAGQDACQGDSGGPMIVLDANGEWRQVGVVSAGRGCAREKFPGVYARVPMLLDFIDERHPTFAPYSAGRPRVSGSGRVGQRLRCHRGNWVGGNLGISFLWAILNRGEPRRIVSVGWFWRATPRYRGRRATCLVFGSNEGGLSSAQARAVRIRGPR